MQKPTEDNSVVVKAVSAISDIDAEAWDACANPKGTPVNPFLSHTFLKILEDTGCVVPEKGWQPVHLTLSKPDGGPILACMPCYFKGHSQGEFVFDHAWADAYHRAGGDYYPKMISAVPFTPVPGRRILVRPGRNADAMERLMMMAAVQVAQKHEVSSLHFNFITDQSWNRLGAAGLLQRMDQQFHFHNPGYETFNDFLDALASRKRKAIRKERKTALASGLTIERLTGTDLKEEHWDAFHGFYEDTGARKWGRPYLNREAFHAFGERMSDDCLLVMAKRDGRYVAGAMNIIGGDCLFGRYWGTTEHHPCLHFEICYYQAIDYAIENRLPRVEAGAQGEHKLARGYVPTTTYSAHWIADPGLRGAV
ncbi:MAG: GNAT family N-acetyltransferase, partial [Pseudomonadota bacterium]